MKLHNPRPTDPSHVPLAVQACVMRPGERIPRPAYLPKETEIRAAYTWPVHRLIAYGFDALVDGVWCRCTIHVPEDHHGRTEMSPRSRGATLDLF